MYKPGGEHCYIIGLSGRQRTISTEKPLSDNTKRVLLCEETTVFTFGVPITYTTQKLCK